MNLLVIGGTRFVGRHILEAALARGDTVTLFNRGVTPFDTPSGVVRLHGDRAGDLSALAAGRWDAAVDCCGYLPGDTARVATVLAPRVGHCVFISSISVYADFAAPRTEGDPVGRIDDDETATVDGRTYGPLKALCEAAVQAAFRAFDTAPGRVLAVRPGLIVGPHDPTQRFTYWPARFARAAAEEAALAGAAPVLAPGSAAAPIQCIDARDLAAFVLGAIDRGLSGAANATSPAGRDTFGDLLTACAQATGSAPPVLWADDAALAEAGVAQWTDLPLGVPSGADSAALMQVSTRAAQAGGLVCRPLAETVRDTLAWWRTLPPQDQAFTKAGLTPEREAQALARCRAGGDRTA